MAAPRTQADEFFEETPQIPDVPQAQDLHTNCAERSGLAPEPGMVAAPPYTPSQLSDDDPRNDISQPVLGWPELALIISRYRGLDSLLIFKDLNLKSLFYYQAELEVLRKDLHRVEWDDHRACQDYCQSRFAYDLDWLLQCRDEAERNLQCVPEQWKLILRLRELLAEYSMYDFLVGEIFHSQSILR